MFIVPPTQDRMVFNQHRPTIMLHYVAPDWDHDDLEYTKWATSYVNRRAAVVGSSVAHDMDDHFSHLSTNEAAMAAITWRCAENVLPC